MLKIAYVDIGELGWSLYLSARIRWLKKNADSMVAVIGLPDRRCLWEGLADDIIDVPKLFYEKYDLKRQDNYRLRKMRWGEFKDFFLPYIPAGYRFAEPNEYPSNINNDNRVFEPYRYSKPPENGREIIVFPRCRIELWGKRNLSENFYLQLIKRLCYEFPRLTVRTIGTKNGAYDIKTDKFNYINWVGKSKDLQDLIDKCQSAIVAVGSQSGPPKISLLQGVPTFMIGHEKKRHVISENWMDTKIGFYEVDRREYERINIDDCIQAIIAFVKEVQ